MTISPLIKIMFGTDVIESMIPERIGIWKRASKWTESKPEGSGAGGEYYEQAITVEWPDSMGWIDGDGATRTALDETDIRWRVYPKLFHAILQIRSWEMALSKTKPQAFDNILDHRRDAFMKAIARRRVFGICGRSDGSVAYITSNYGPASAAIPVRGMYGFVNGLGTYVSAGAELFYPGMRIVIDPSGTAQARVVTGRNIANGTISVSGGNVTVTAGMAITFGESAAKSDYAATAIAPTGFGDLFADTAAYENIDPATYPLWKPSVYNGSTPGTLEPLDSSHMTKVVLGPDINGGKKINVVMMHSNLLQSFVQLYEQQIDYVPTKFDGGMDRVTWKLPGHPVEVFFDPLSPHNCIIGLTESAFRRFQNKEGDWEDMDGNMFKFVQGYLKYVAAWTEGWTMGTPARFAHAIHRDIREEVQLAA